MLQKSLTTIIGGDNKERVAPLAEAVGRFPVEMQIIGTLPDLDAVGGFHVELVAGLDAEERVPVVGEARKAVHAVVGSRVFIDILLIYQILV